MRKSFRQIATFMDPVSPPKSVRQLIGMHGVTGTSTSYRDIWRRHNHPEAREQEFLFLNTFLMDIRDADLTKGSKPAVETRARETGRLIRDHVDIAALAEVWLNRERDRILSEWPKDARPRTRSKGPPPHYAETTARLMFDSAGLMTVSQTFPIVDVRRDEFIAEQGRDERADKGVLLAVVDVGVGPSNLEVYVTHTNAGDGRTARMARILQIVQLGRFVNESHDRSNPALIVGDFNVGAHTSDSVDLREVDAALAELESRTYPVYAEVPERFLALLRGLRDLLASRPGPWSEHDVLTAVLGNAGFRDLWAWRNGTLGYTSRMNREGVAERICRREAGSRFCDDSNLPRPPFVVLVDDEEKVVDRIDYVFVNEAAATHSFTLDFTRPRRITTEREGDEDEFLFLSDHLGIETRLLIVPR